MQPADSHAERKTLEAVFDEALAEIAGSLSYERASVVLIDRAGDAYLRIARSPRGQRLETRNVTISENLRQVFRHARGMVNPEVQPSGDRTSNTLLDLGIRCTLIAPLMLGDTVVGTLNAGTTEPRSYGAKDLAKLQAIADKYAAALAHAHDAQIAATEALERAEAMHTDRLASLGQLTTSLAHEINNPASVLFSNLEHTAQLLQELRDADPSPDPERSKRYDDLLEMAADNLAGVASIAAIVDELRAYSGAQGTGSELVDLNQVVRRAARLTANAVEQRGTLTLDLGEIPLTVGQPERLNQLVLNLLLNAHQALEPGASGEVHVETRSEGDEVVVRVSDTGCGIPEDRRALVFRPFFTTKADGVGTGMGLAVCQEITRRHEGRIELASVVGTGTTVEVRLPRRAPAYGIPAPQEIPALEEPLARARVLVVDDDPNVLRSTARSLSLRHDTLVAASGEEALELLAADPKVDAIVCDVTMPHIDGVEFYDRLGTIDPALRERVVFLTGGIFDEEVKRRLEQIGNPVLRKPAPRALLFASVSEVLGDEASP